LFCIGRLCSMTCEQNWYRRLMQKYIGSRTFLWILRQRKMNTLSLKLLVIQPTLLDKVVQQINVDRIPPDALHAGFEGRPRRHKWWDNIIWTNAKWSNELGKMTGQCRFLVFLFLVTARNNCSLVWYLKLSKSFYVNYFFNEVQVHVDAVSHLWKISKDNNNK